MTDSPQIAVAVYSRSGHSLRLAEALAAQLGAPIVMIEAPAYRGAFGYVRAAFDSLRQRSRLPVCPTPLTDFNTVVLCGPVWTSYPSTPLRALLRVGATTLPDHVALYLTSGAHSPAEKAIATATADFGKPFVASAVQTNAEEGTDSAQAALETFCAQVTP